MRVLLDVLFASALGVLLFTRVKEQRTLWLLRGYLFLVSLAWFVQRFANLPITSKLVDALVLACIVFSNFMARGIKKINGIIRHRKISCNSW